MKKAACRRSVRPLQIYDAVHPAVHTLMRRGRKCIADVIKDTHQTADEREGA